jgi:hypothetical protein
MGPSYKQSEENYEYLYDNVKHELCEERGFQKVTRNRILDRFLEKGRINKKFHHDVLKEVIILDKADEKYDMISSLLVSASTLLFFLIVFIPEKETFTRLLFSIYILCIYLMAYIFYR